MSQKSQFVLLNEVKPKCKSRNGAERETRKKTKRDQLC